MEHTRFSKKLQTLCNKLYENAVQMGGLPERKAGGCGRILTNQAGEHRARANLDEMFDLLLGKNLHGLAPQYRIWNLLVEPLASLFRAVDHVRAPVVN